MLWILLTISSAITLALRQIFAKKLANRYPTVVFLFLLSVISTIFTLIFIEKIEFSLSLSNLLLLILKSGVITFGWYLLYDSYKHLDISVVSPLQNLSPIFLIVLNFIFVGEVISFWNYVGVFIVIISVYLINTEPKNIFLPMKLYQNKYFWYTIISLIMSSISAILDKVLLQTISQWTLMFWFYLFLSILYFIFLVYNKEISYLSIKKVASHKQSILIVLIATICAFIADVTYFSALYLIGSSIVLIISLRRTSNILVTIFGGMFFAEKNLLYRGLICVLAVIGVVLGTI